MDKSICTLTSTLKEKRWPVAVFASHFITTSWVLAYIIAGLPTSLKVKIAMYVFDELVTVLLGVLTVAIRLIYYNNSTENVF